MKKSIADLAMFGGAPAFEAPLHVGRPNIGDRDVLMKRFADILDRRWFTNDGPYQEEFERAVAASAGVPHAVAVCNATIGLELVFEALQLTGEVIMPSFTFVATAHAALRLGLTPVFCDIDPVTHTIDPDAVARAITPATSAIVGVHLWGHRCDVEALGTLARDHGLRLIFDAAHAFACSNGGVPVGGFGDAEVFSFHATKFVNSFEGGAITTNSAVLDGRLRLARNFGFVDYDRVDALGTNAKMTEVCAAMGLTSIESVEEFVAVNKRNHRRYESALAGIKALRFVTGAARAGCNFQYVVTELNDSAAPLNRDLLIELLRAENVLSRRYFYPGCHRMEPYFSSLPLRHPLPVTERVAAQVIVLPNGTAVDEAAIDGIAAVVRFAIDHAEEVAARAGGAESAKQ